MVRKNQAIYNKTKREKYRNDEEYRNKIIEKAKKYCQIHKKERKAYKEKYYQKNRDKILDNKKKYWKENCFKISEIRRKKRIENPEKMRKWLRNNRMVNKERWSEYDKKHYKKIKKFKVKQDKRYVKEAFDECKNQCLYCGSKEDIQIDHILPVLKGGKHKLNNLVIACNYCNKSKGGTSDVIGWCLKMKRDIPNLIWEKLIAQGQEVV